MIKKLIQKIFNTTINSTNNIANVEGSNNVIIQQSTQQVKEENNTIIISDND